MKLLKDLRNAAIAATIIGAPLGIYPIAASATGTDACQAVVSTDKGDWDTFGTDATVKLTENGARISTPNRVDRVRWSVAETGDMVNLKRVTYRTFVHSDGDRGFAAPAVRIGLDTNHDGAADKTLVFEPYFNGTVTEGAWQAWEVVADDSKLWDSSDATQTNKTWAQWLAELGDSATVRSVNVGLGTWNEGADARVNNLRIVDKGGCHLYTWTVPATQSPTATPTSASPSATATPTATATPSASATPSATPTVSKTPTATATPSTAVPTTAAPTGPVTPTATESVPAGMTPVGDSTPGGGLPTTGVKATMMFAVGAALVLFGGVAYLWARRNREDEFAPEV